MTNQHARQDVLRVLHRLCSQDIKTHDVRSLESKTKQKNQTTHLSAYWVPGLLRRTFSLTLPFPVKVWSETVKPSRITGKSLRSFGETEGGRDACTETSWCIHPSQRIKHPGRGTRCQAISRQLPVCIAITLLQKLDDFWNRVGGISGTEQVQQDFPPIFVIYYAGQGTDDFLYD